MENMTTLKSKAEQKETLQVGGIKKTGSEQVQ